jgi:hypothetical protein
MNQIAQSAGNNSFIRDAFISGDLDKVSSKWRGVLSAAGLDKPVSTYYKMNEDTRQIETSLQRLTTEETAAYLKKISGAQVSHQEYDRIKGMFPQAGNLAEQNAQLGYWNTVVPGVLLQLEQSGVMTGQNAQQISSALVKVATRWSGQYMNDLRNIKAKGKEERKKTNLDAYTDLDSLATEVLREAFPQSVGTTITVPHSDNRFGVGTSYVHIPSGSVRVQEMDKSKPKASAPSSGTGEEQWNRDTKTGKLVKVR